VQLEAMRIITGLRRGTSRHILYAEMELETFKSRRQKNHKLLPMYKLINGFTPEYLIV